MVAPLHSNYSNRKGIYKDLYREIDSDNKKRTKEEEISKTRKPSKGIYADLYRQIEEDKIKFSESKSGQEENSFWHKGLSNLSFYISRFETVYSKIKPNLLSIVQFTR